MFRPNLAFLDNIPLKCEFEAEVRKTFEQTSEHLDWDPHTKLEFCKVMLRTIVAEFSLKFKKKINDKHSFLIGELDRLHNLKNEFLNRNGVNAIDNIEADIYDTECALEQVLIDKTKVLVMNSRVKWLDMVKSPISTFST